jgi:uncharacterized protein (DUF1501 family)
MKRRTFLQSTLASAAIAPVLLDNVYARPSTPLKLLAQLKQQSNNNNILILVQLFGGNDGLNTIIPADDPNYYNLRQNIAIAQSALTNYNYGGVYFNPGLANGNKGGLFQMFQTGSLAVIRGIGYNPPNLSHFYSTDVWLSGVVPAAGTNYTFNTGWLGRMLEKQYPNFPTSLPPDPLAINLGGFSLALLGDTTNMGIVVDNPSLQAGGLSSTDNALDDNATGTRYATEYAFVQAVAEMSNTYAARVKAAYNSGKTKLKGTYGTDGFSQQMASVAAMIAGGLNTSVYVVGSGGFDTHVNQVSGGDPTHATGAHTNLLGQIADGIAQFQSDMIQLGTSVADRVIGFTVSEFGRRPHDNGSYGTDHGAASVQFAFGTQINAAVFGNPPLLDTNDLDANGDLKVQVDYRSVYLTLLTDWFGMSLTDAQTVMENQLDLPNPMGNLIKPAAGVSPAAPISLSLSVYPNPMASNANLSLELPNSAYTEIEMASMDGKRVQQILARTMGAGSYSIPLTTDVPSGAYLLSLRSGSERVARVVEVIR